MRELELKVGEPAEGETTFPEPSPDPSTRDVTRAEIGGRWLWLLLAVTLVHGLLYAFIVPPWQHPDEPGHFEHARLIAEEHRLPGITYVSPTTRREIAISMLEYGFWKGMGQPSLDDATLAEGSPIAIPALSQPRLYYVLSAVWLQPWLAFSVEAQVYALRLLAILLNLAVVAATWRGMLRLWPAAPYMAVAVCGLIVFEPQYTDMMASVNNDVLANALGAAYFLIVAELFRQGWRWRLAISAGAVVVLGLLTKTTFVAVAATLPLLALTFPWRRRWARWASWLGAVGGIAIAGGFLWLSAQGTFPPVLAGIADRVQRYFRVYWLDTVRSVLGLNPDGPDLGAVVSVVFRSFWAYFGWRHIEMPDAYYLVPLALTMVAFVGAGVGAVRWLRSQRECGWRARYLVFAFLSALLVWAVAILRSQAVQGLTTYSHGRYAFVGMVPFAVVMAGGVLAWVRPSRGPLAAVGLVVVLAAFDGACLWSGLTTPYWR